MRSEECFKASSSPTHCCEVPCCCKALPCAGCRMLPGDLRAYHPVSAQVLWRCKALSSPVHAAGCFKASSGPIRCEVLYCCKALSFPVLTAGCLHVISGHVIQSQLKFLWRCKALSSPVHAAGCSKASSGPIICFEVLFCCKAPSFPVLTAGCFHAISGHVMQSQLKSVSLRGAEPPCECCRVLSRELRAHHRPGGGHGGEGRRLQEGNSAHRCRAPVRGAHLHAPAAAAGTPDASKGSRAQGFWR